MPRGAPDWKPWTAVQRFSEVVGAQTFEQKLNVPANTPNTSPISQAIELTKGFVAKVSIRFPSGPAGLLGIAIFDGATQLWPGITATWFTGDNETIEFETEYVVPFVNTGAEKYKLTAKGFNDDDTYPHTALVRIWVVKFPA